MIITVTNNSASDVLIISPPTSTSFVSITNWTNNALQPGDTATATATLPSTGYIGGDLQFNHNLNPSEFTISAAFSYYERVVTGTIMNLRLNEIVGSIANDTSPKDNDGSYSNVTLNAVISPAPPDGMPQFFGNSFVDLYSADFASDFNPDLGSIAFFLQADTVATWSDPTYMQLLRLMVDGNNRIDIYKNTSPTDQVVYNYIAGGTTVTGVADVPHTLLPYHIAFTWNKSRDRCRAYFQGIQVGADITGLGAWAGALNSALCVLGGESIFASLGWYGYLSQLRIYDKELTAQEVASLSL